MSNLNDILDAVVADHVTAALQIGGNNLTVVKRKLPKREETVDSAYQVTICAAQISESVERIAPGGKYLIKYFIEMTLITPSDGDALLNLVDHTNWREATRARYQATSPLPSLAYVKRIDIVPSQFLDRSKLAEGYDYDQIAINVWVFESR